MPIPSYRPDNPDTYLSSVNSVLAAIGQAPVETIDQDNPELMMILQIIMETAKDTQAEGWVFNTENHYPMEPDAQGYIEIKDHVLRLDISEGQTWRTSDVVRRPKPVTDASPDPVVAAPAPTPTPTPEPTPEPEPTDDDLELEVAQMTGGCTTCAQTEAIYNRFPDFNDEGFVRDNISIFADQECNQGELTYEQAQQNDSHCVPPTCNTFKWDCYPKSIKVCQYGCYDAYASTHGCNGNCPAGDLEYRWERRDPGSGSGWTTISDWSRKVKYTFHAHDKLPGEVIMCRITARCKDFPGGVQRLDGPEFEVKIVDCSDGPELTLTCPTSNTGELKCVIKNAAFGEVVWRKDGTTVAGPYVIDEDRYVTRHVADGDGEYWAKITYNGKNYTSNRCQLKGEAPPPPPVDPECSLDSDCPGTLICVNGECVEPPEPEPCPPDLNIPISPECDSDNVPDPSPWPDSETKQTVVLYDKMHHTFFFGCCVLCDVVWLLPFPALPPAFQRYITSRASVRAAAQLVNNPQLFQLLQQQEASARAACIEYETTQGDYSFMGFPDGTVYQTYQPWQTLDRNY